MSKNCFICGQNESEVNLLFKGKNGAYVCDACIDRCADALKKVREIAVDDKADVSGLQKPSEIKAHLDDYIIGQEEAKKTVSVAVYNHYKRLAALKRNNPDGFEDVEIQKSNILLAGPTGSGKTLIAKTIADLLNVPFAIADATSLTEAGYIGDDVESVLLKLIKEADGDIEKAEEGIIFIDEIDKLKSAGADRGKRDAAGQGVQDALLKILEGATVDVPAKKGKEPFVEYYQIDTKNILFICGGAFRGIEKVIEERTKEKKTIGFGGQEEKVKKKETKKVTHKDLKEYGMASEFLGRLPVIATLEELDKDALCNILTEPKNAIVEQYRYLLAMDGVDLKFDKDALREIAKEAKEMGTGARGLKTIMEKVMLEPMYSLPSEGRAVCVVTRNCLTEGASPKIIPEGKSQKRLSNRP